VRYYTARRVPVVVRLLLVLLFALLALIVGAMVGYAGLGGGDALDVLDPSTWTHITDFWTTT